MNPLVRSTPEHSITVNDQHGTVLRVVFPREQIMRVKRTTHLFQTPKTMEELINGRRVDLTHHSIDECSPSDRTGAGRKCNREAEGGRT